MLTPQQIAEADAYIKAKYPSFSYIHGDTFQATVTIPGGAVANVGVLMTITVDGTAATFQTVPSTQVWRFNDIYTTVAGDAPISATVTFWKNRIKTLATTAPLPAQLVTNQTRPGLPQCFVYEPVNIMTLYAAPVATVDATATDTDNAYLDVTIYDSSYSG